MSGSTIYLQGTFIPPNSNDPVPFTIETLFAWGAVSTLTDADLLHLTESDLTTDIVVERQLDALFDDLDFLNMDSKEWETAVLRTLTNNTNISIKPQIP